MYDYTSAHNYIFICIREISSEKTLKIVSRDSFFPSRHVIVLQILLNSTNMRCHHAGTHTKYLSTIYYKLTN